MNLRKIIKPIKHSDRFSKPNHNLISHQNSSTQKNSENISINSLNIYRDEKLQSTSFLPGLLKSFSVYWLLLGKPRKNQHTYKHSHTASSLSKLCQKLLLFFIREGPKIINNIIIIIRKNVCSTLLYGNVDVLWCGFPFFRLKDVNSEYRRRTEKEGKSF